MTDDFLEYTRRQGNDLTTPSGGFPGLRAGDNWCVCAGRYSEAARDGHAPPIVASATHERALEWEAVRRALALQRTRA